MKKVYVSLLVLVLFVYLFRFSYAMSVEEINFNLFLNENNELEVNEVEEYIDLVDDNIMTNSSFNVSSKLNENYDFLTRFAISFILDNLDYFEVVLGDDYKYIDEYGREYISNKYIDLDTLYEVTNSIFGVDYYYILDQGLIVNDKVILVDFEQEFDMKIDRIDDIYIGNDHYDVYVKYIDSEIIYVYSFEVTYDNRLVISNLSIKG